MLFGTSVQAASADPRNLFLPSFVDVSDIADGLVLKTYRYDKLFNAKQIVRMVEVDLSKRQVKPIDFSGCQKISDAAPMQNVLAAVNGTFFGSDCSPRNYLKIDGRLYSTNIIRAAGSAAFLLDALQTPRIAFLGAKEDPLYSEQGIGGFPQLVLNRKVNIKPEEKTNFFRNRYPRTAVGITGPNIVTFVTVDGASSASAGFTIREFAEYLGTLGFISAVNLDGGTSTTLWIKDQGVVNRPSGARGEPRVANGLAVF